LEAEQACESEGSLARAETPKAERPLDALNFFLADVRDGLGPYLAIYLLTEQKWDQASILRHLFLGRASSAKLRRASKRLDARLAW
jgi:hypothetical protein